MKQSNLIYRAMHGKQYLITNLPEILYTLDSSFNMNFNSSYILTLLLYPTKVDL